MQVCQSIFRARVFSLVGLEAIGPQLLQAAGSLLSLCNGWPSRAAGSKVFLCVGKKNVVVAKAGGQGL